MKLLTRTGAENKIRKENDELISQNIRLRQFEKAVTERLNNVKDSYEPDKLAKLKEFELFVKDIMAKKAKLLIELDGIGKLIEEKKELFYGLVARADELAETKYQIEEETRKLQLREAFVIDLETKWREKQ